MQTITSRKNSLISRCRDVGRGDVEGLILLDGAHLVREALDAGIRIQEAVAAANALDRDEIRTIVRAVTSHGVAMVLASTPVMDVVSPGRSASRIVAIAERPADAPERVYAGHAPMVVIAAGVQDPGNLGAIVRVAEAAGATGVVAAGASADPFGWKALRGSMGSALRLPMAVRRDAGLAVHEAKSHGCRIVATVPRGGQSPEEIDFTGPLALLIGGEGSGVEPAVVAQADRRVTIPMKAPVESLNASVAAAILIYEARRQRMLEL